MCHHVDAEQVQQRSPPTLILRRTARPRGVIRQRIREDQPGYTAVSDGVCAVDSVGIFYSGCERVVYSEVLFVSVPWD